MKKWIFGFAFLLGSLCSVTAAGETNTFVFVPGQSTVVQTGGIAGVYETYSIEGQFQLTVDFDAGIASFDEVDANLTDGSIWLYTRDLGVLFNMTELAGTVISDTTIEFEGRTADGTNTEIHILVTLTGNSAHLTGETVPPCCDFFIYNLDAVALLHPNTYYADAVNGDDNNDGLSPETAFATIQKGIDSASDGCTVIVYPGRYTENINFLGKNITLTSTEPTNTDIVNRTTIIDGAVWFRGTEDPNCTLTGFNINGFIAGFDWLIDPNGDNHTHATISHCVLENIITGCGRLIYACDGTISNCVIANISYMCLSPSPTPAIVGCHGLFKNCTIANAADGIEILPGGTCTIENCIIYRSSPIIVRSGATLNISYCDLQGGLDWFWVGGTVNWGPGNIDTDPCFARLGNWQDKGDYHLKSAAGRWGPNQNNWVYDANTSVCIDAGNPGCPLGDEPNDVNNIRINMGAYGGTAEASKSPANWRNIADLTNDWVVDFTDLAAFVNYWLETSQCIPSDLNRSQFVDFSDFAIFAQQWLDTLAIEPGITYQVDDCNMEAGRTSPVAAEADELRFSVRVEGSYIHFEDLITANCCADEIELQMTMQDNLITIYEIEHLTMPCDCICDYPVTATLGPFEEGNYLVEVIDVNGSSLGVVEVTIGESLEPSITYQIEDCNQAASGLFEEESIPTRFSAVVEGQYIHFEDMMTANCCPDELGLEMTVEDNLITIYETEYTPGGCWCICDYPVTATLGPFEPGTYTLEVYEDWGGFIGRTIVTIGPAE